MRKFPGGYLGDSMGKVFFGEAWWCWFFREGMLKRLESPAEAGWRLGGAVVSPRMNAGAKGDQAKA